MDVEVEAEVVEEEGDAEEEKEEEEGGGGRRRRRRRTTLIKSNNPHLAGGESIFVVLGHGAWHRSHEKSATRPMAGQARHLQTTIK